MPAALLITGTVGAGKTTVAEAVGDLLTGREIPNAVIDLDWLRRAWPAPPGDRFNGALTLRNLEAVAANFVAAGASRLVLAGVLESRAELHAYGKALEMPLTVCRLRVALPTVRERLRRRHALDPAGLAWHLARSGELDAILTDALVEDYVVDVVGETPAQVAVAVTRDWMAG
ncbi:adenylyl-sulfate kinase [Actinoplanes bogorensis]|uniref:UDP-N-acetylglucosamine kinase n=1 Tax=Paractinoplanes bogorensis TaxID=1610840 RepID=A0ABS5Z5M2_9ACTN|nr:adenylyl-sulfate kinase [Actinoplanes bogorensis]MBU2670656.1 adenylyl-sulfate kinase [Actinoplanes bogorensis]